MGDSQAQDALVAAVSEKINRWLAEITGGYDVDGKGRASFRIGSARIFVAVEPWSDDHTLVRIGTLLLSDVPKSPELNEWMAYNANNYYFGTLCIAENGDDANKVQVILDHVLLGDYIDLEEFRSAVAAIATTADEVDTELKEKFGGETFHEDQG